jgi:hypothetical protein
LFQAGAKAADRQTPFFMQLRPSGKFKTWLKRVGWLGFLFFLIKGLLWLIIPYLIAKGVFGK